MKLLDVTVDPRFRSTLRIYRFDTFTDFPPAVRVRIYDLCGLSPIDRNCSSAPFAETTLVLRKTENDPNHPDFAMIGNLVDAFPQLTNVQPIDLPPLNYFRPAAVRIEIEPLTADLRFWAFVSVTNNETQHVTVITPQ